jgi:hypothetical protein
MTFVFDWIEAHTPNDPRLLRSLDFVLPLLVLAVLVMGIIQVGRVSDVAQRAQQNTRLNRANLSAQEHERAERIYATNGLDEYFCGQIEAIKGAIEGILNASLALPPRPGSTPQQLEVRQLIAQRLARLEGGGACKVRIPSPP